VTTIECLTESHRSQINDPENRWTAVGLSAICFCLALGCQPQLDLVPLKGQVNYANKPLEYGSVMFQPVGGGPLARGQIQADGSFVLTTLAKGDGVKPGVSRLRITAFDAQKPGALAKEAQEMMLGESAIPKKYQHFGTSGIEIEVAPDTPQPVVIELE